MRTLVGSPTFLAIKLILFMFFVGSVSSQEAEEDTTPVVDFSEAFGDFSFPEIPDTVDLFQQPDIETGLGDFIELFEWKEGFYALDAPRRGANTFVTLPILNPNKPKRVDLRVSPINNSATAKVAVFVNPVIPNVYVYENDPVYGIINERVVGSNVFINENQSITVTAIPYFFNKGEGQGHMFDWFLENQEL